MRKKQANQLPNIGDVWVMTHAEWTPDNRKHTIGIIISVTESAEYCFGAITPEEGLIWLTAQDLIKIIVPNDQNVEQSTNLV